MRTDIPAETTRHSLKIWNHVDELRVDPQLVARLAQNGLRIGAASRDAWPAIEAVFAACDARSRKEQIIAQGGLPLSIEIGSISGSESIFSHGRSGRLRGKTFTAGNKLANLDYMYRPEFGGVVDLQLSFEVRHDRGVMTWEKRDGIIRQVPAYDRYLFEDLRVLLTLNTHEFLVIGPSEETRNPYLIGSRFFTGQTGGGRYDTLFCITPQPYQTPRAFQRAG